MILRRALIGLTTAAVAAAVAAPAGATSILFTGQTLASGQALSSDDGHYELTMQADGNLVLSDANPLGTPRTLFSTGTGNDPGAYARLEPTGNLVVYSAGGSPVWSDNATAAGCANLDVQTDGNLVADTAAGTFWSTGTVQHEMISGDELLPGQHILGSGGYYQLQMDSDGVLRAVDSAGTVWASPGAPAGSYAEMATDGELEVISPQGTVAWSPDTTESPGAHLDMLADGNVPIVSSAGHIVWQSSTGASRAGLRSLNYVRPFVACPAAPTPSPPAPTPVQPVLHGPTNVTHRSPTHLRLPGTHTGLRIAWRYRGPRTWIHSVTVTGFPRGGRLALSCSGRRGCPTALVRRHGRRVLVHRRFSTDRRHLRAFERALTGRSFRVGDHLRVVATQPRHRAERNVILIRDGRSPRLLTPPAPAR